jgi:hypothetical protein
MNHLDRALPLNAGSLGSSVQLSIYTLKSAAPPWGDYGNVLWHGLATEERGALILERTGPFVPPITFPGLTIVVTDGLRRLLDVEAFSGYEWRPVIKKRVVALDWTEWDLSAEDPGTYPAGGEPENYILGRKHNEQAARAMTDLWQLYVIETPGLQKEGGAIESSLYRGQDICRGHTCGHLYISARLKDWLEGHVAEWVSIAAARQHA